MVNIFLFLGITFMLILTIGKILEKIRIPWIFSALLVGAIISFYSPFKLIVASDTFNFIAQMGMYFLLFIIGFEINLKKLEKCGRFIFRATFIIIFLEAVLGTLLIHFLFNISWGISFLVALSFATVGEAILIPILDEFKIINTKLGQSIIGIGTLDDIIEIFLLIAIGFLVGTQTHSILNILLTLLSIGALLVLTVGLRKLKPSEDTFNFTKIEVLFLLIIFVLFIFIGIGELAHIAPFAALLAGVSLSSFIPKNRIDKVKRDVRALCYGFFAPIFFLWVGASIDFSHLLSLPLFILAVFAVSSSAKLLGSYIVGKKELGAKQSILLGIGLSVRFSTSIIITKILYDNKLIDSDLYSIIVASSVVFIFLVPLLFSKLVVKWNIFKKKKN